MKSIYKFPLGTIDVLSKGVTAEIPAAAQITYVGMQGDQVTVWAIVPVGAPPAIRTFRLYGTGWEMLAEPYNPVATIFDGPFVWHVGETTPERF